MGMTQFQSPGPSAGINSQIESYRAAPVVLRNSRFLIAVTMLCSIACAFIAVCMAIFDISTFSISGPFAFYAWKSFCYWLAGALAFGYGCPRLWKLARAMAVHQVQMDGRGVNFILGTKKKPAVLFLLWDQIASIKQKRIGHAQQFYVQSKAGSEARFSSYTFFRPRKVARMIAERAGVAIQKI